MNIVTWNVNSIRSRQDRLLPWLRDHRPAVLCLQELKCTEDVFPLAEIRALGYHAAVSCQKTYNGVAILSLDEPQDVRMGLDDGDPDSQARLIAATVAGVRIICAYFPNGSEVGSDKYAYKKLWIQRLQTYLQNHHRPDEPLVLCGDFNIAPDARDVGNENSWEGSILYNPDMREAFARFLAWGFEDAVRRHRPEPGLFSWWDYRMFAFPKNEGLRIDHVLATKPLRSIDAFVDRNERKADKPSDHVPVGVTFVK